MTSEVIDTAQSEGLCCRSVRDLEERMTALTTTRETTTEDRLRTVLRADAVVTGAIGLFALVGPTSIYGDVPGWLPRTIGAVLLFVAIDLVIAARWSGSQLRMAGVVCADLAFAWVVASVAVAVLVDLPMAGREVLLLSALVTLGFAVAELRLVRSLSAAIR